MKNPSMFGARELYAVILMALISFFLFADQNLMAIGLGAIIGGFVGGLIGNRLYNIKPRYMPMLCCITTLVGVIPVAYLLNYPSQVGVENPSATVHIVVGLLAGFIISITGPNVKAILLNVNAPETRGSIFSLFNLADDLGKGFGPVIISLLIVGFGRVWAFNIANLFWVICGIILFFMMRTFPEDEAVLDKTLEERAKTMIK